ncbi:hypothetical protein DFJ77DRAFT_475733 [Powellomyces hirtus]|nr:hypothetical protein DFJ77DRAFT_475733 [Powellomyces hirtus]
MYSPLSPLSSRQPPHSPNDSTDFIALLSPGQTQTPHSPPSRRPHCHPFSLLSRHSRLLLILLGTLLIIGSAAFVLSPLSAIITPDASLPGHRQSEPPCTTRECVLTAAGMLANMNTSVDPCEDFFEYSCGGWMSNNPIPDTKPSYTQFVKLTESNWRVVKDALESPYRADPVLTPEDATSNRNNFEKVQGLYASCMNETRIEELDSAPLTALLTILTAHLPLSTTADPNTTSPTKLFAALAALHNHRVASLFAMEVGQDDKNPTINVLILGNDGLSLPSKEYYTNTEFVATLQQSVRNVLVKMGEVIAGGGNGTDADAAGRAERVVAFEKEVAEFTPSRLGDLTSLLWGYTSCSVCCLLYNRIHSQHRSS